MGKGKPRILLHNPPPGEIGATKQLTKATGQHFAAAFAETTNCLPRAETIGGSPGLGFTGVGAKRDASGLGGALVPIMTVDQTGLATRVWALPSAAICNVGSTSRANTLASVASKTLAHPIRDALSRKPGTAAVLDPDQQDPRQQDSRKQDPVQPNPRQRESRQRESRQRDSQRDPNRKKGGSAFADEPLPVRVTPPTTRGGAG